MSESGLVLFGAGAAGSYALKFLRERGIHVSCFADNNIEKQGTEMGGVGVLSPEDALAWAPSSTWVATAISRPAAMEIRDELRMMGVPTKPLWECIPVCHGLPSDDAWRSTYSLCSDIESDMQWRDQMKFRANPDYDAQIDPTPCSELYFPDFITHLDDEVFIDCGAADGDTVKDFLKRWPEFRSIIAFEPDQQNYNKLCKVFDPKQAGRITKLRMAVADFDGDVDFTANGDYSSHLSGVESRDASGGSASRVRVTTLDKMLGSNIPTYIKADVEGSELELIWGARNLIKNHSPVLAICAYHTSDHAWQIPLLVNAINPEYKCFFRRYAEGSFEIVWYFVPPSRVVGSTAPMSYSDDHVG